LAGSKRNGFAQRKNAMSEYKFTEFLNPLLRALKELGGSARPSEVCDFITKDLSLPDSFLAEHLRNGVSKFENRVHWARYYLAKSGYIGSSRYGVWLLTEKGHKTAPLTAKAMKDLVQEVNRLSRSSSSTLSEVTEPVSAIEDDEEATPTLLRDAHRAELLCNAPVLIAQWI
jgi:restriction system protein